jgi:hypothetical protein
MPFCISIAQRHGVDHAAKLDEAAVAGSLDDAPVVRVDRGVDQVAAQAAKTARASFPRQPSESAVADDVGH